MRRALGGITAVALLFALFASSPLPGASEMPGSQEPSSPSQTKTPNQSGQPTRAQPDTDGVYEGGNGVKPPQVLSSIEAEYTDQARKKRLNGTCLIALVVGAEGTPRDIQVKRSVAEGLSPKATELSCRKFVM